MVFQKYVEQKQGVNLKILVHVWVPGQGLDVRSIKDSSWSMRIA